MMAVVQRCADAWRNLTRRPKLAKRPVPHRGLRATRTTAAFSKFKRGEPVRVVFLNQNGIVDGMQGDYVRVRMSKSWSHLAEPDGLIRLTIDGKDETKVRSSVFGDLA